MDGKNNGILKNTVRLLGCVDREHRAIIESKVEKLGVHRTQHMIIMYLARHDGAAQNELARAFDVSSSAVTSSIKKLEAAGLIERTKKPGDERINCLSLTAEGREMVERSRRLFRTVDEAMFAGFTAEEIDRITDYLTRLKINLKEYAAAELRDGPDASGDSRGARSEADGTKEARK